MTEEVAEEPVVAPTPRLTWKERSVKLFDARTVAREAQVIETKRKLTDAFREALTGVLGREQEVDDTRAELDGVVFVGHFQTGSGAEVWVETTCVDCEQPYEVRVRGLADIGAIVSGHPDPHPDCPSLRVAVAEKELTPGEKLLLAMRAYLESELEEVPD